MSFKPGDKVKMTQPVFDMDKGIVGTVMEVLEEDSSNTKVYLVDFDGIPWNMYADEIEAVHYISYLQGYNLANDQGFLTIRKAK